MTEDDGSNRARSEARTRSPRDEGIPRRGTRLWRTWVELWDRREPPTALALVRIAIALVALIDLVNVRRLGLVDALWTRSPTGYATAAHTWLTGGALWTCGVVAAVAMLIGAATRIACLVFVIASVQMSRLAPGSETGVDMVFRIACTILALSRCDAKWSIDALVLRRLGRPPPAEVPAWPRLLLMLQLVWIYFSGAQNKSGAEWGPFGGFTALADALCDPHSARFDPAWVAAVYPLTRVATALTMLFELGAPLYLVFYYFAETRERPGRLRALCNRLRLRWVWIALGVSFELGIAIALRLGNFPWGMLALFPVLLLPRELRVPEVPRREAPS